MIRTSITCPLRLLVLGPTAAVGQLEDEIFGLFATKARPKKSADGEAKAA